jgi:hypothetical protein
MNAQSGRMVQAFLNEDESITLVQSNPDPDTDGDFVEHRVTIGIRDLAGILSEFGLAEIEEVDDEEG